MAHAKLVAGRHRAAGATRTRADLPTPAAVLLALGGLAVVLVIAFRVA